MQPITNQNMRSGKLAFLLIAFAILAGFQTRSAEAEDEYIELRETVVNLDPKQLRQAAGEGDASAQTSLSLMYLLGEGVLEDDREAAKWFRKAAEAQRRTTDLWKRIGSSLSK